MRLAAIDIGTNSTKMTVADVSANGTLVVVSEQSEVTRLGEGVDASRRLTKAAMSRTLDAVLAFAAAARYEGAEYVLAAGTSALRDAANGADFIAMVKSRAQVIVEIIAGDREAQLAYAAVRSDSSLPLPQSANLLVFDIGGGSTELILGDATGVGRHKSLDIGAVRLTERFLHSDPPTEYEVEQATHYARAAFGTFPLPDTAPLIAGIGGTAINLAAVTHKLDLPDPDAVHGVSLSIADVTAALDHFKRVDLAERRLIPGLEPKRADVIIAGAIILDCLLTYFSADQFLISARGLRYGLLAEYFKSL